MDNERLFNGRKIESILVLRGQKVRHLAAALDICETYARQLVKKGVFKPKVDREIKEQRLVSFLGLASIDEILAKPKADEAA